MERKSRHIHSGLLGVVFHFFFVELRPLYFFYFSCRALLISQTVYAMSLFRDPVVETWCQNPHCLESLGATITCLTRGVRRAMWSFDLQYEHPEYCTKFYNDNVCGYLHMTLLVIGFVGLIGIVREFCKVDLKLFQFTSGEYLHFSKRIMSNSFVLACLFMIQVYTTCLLVMMLLLPVTVLRTRIQERYDDLWHFYEKWLQSAALPWFAVALSAYFLLFTDRTALDFGTTECLADVTFKRSWLDLVHQTNSELAARLERNVLRENITGEFTFSNILEDPTVQAEYVLRQFGSRPEEPRGVKFPGGQALEYDSEEDEEYEDDEEDSEETMCCSRSRGLKTLKRQVSHM